MPLTVLERHYSPPLPTPVTYEGWMQFNHRLDGCLEARDVHWHCSLVSCSGDRSVCLFQAPYAEAVRQACRQAQMPFKQVWWAAQWPFGDGATMPESHPPVVVEVAYDPPITQAVHAAQQQQAADCLRDIDIYPAYSLVTADGRRSLCVFRATCAEDVRSLYRKVQMPFERIWKAVLIQPEGA